MGVDAGIFAKKAKRYFWFDRLHNVQQFQWLPSDPQADEAFDKLYFSRNASLSDVIYVMNLNIKAWKKESEPQQSRANWSSSIIEFALTFPYDEFFISTDHTDAFDLIGDMHGRKDLWTGEYSEWKNK
jgi:hypothetical protein